MADVQVMLETDRLMLRSFMTNDVSQLPSLCGDIDVARMCAVVPHPYTVTDAIYFVETICAADNNLTLAIVLKQRYSKEGKELIGCVSLDDIRDSIEQQQQQQPPPQHQPQPQQQEQHHHQQPSPLQHHHHRRMCGTIGYWLGKQFWGKGFATEAVRAMVEHGFSKIGLVVVHGTHWLENTASANVMKKLGFQHVLTNNDDVMMRPCVARGGELVCFKTLQVFPPDFEQACHAIAEYK